jgi:hypothetical protein
MIVRRRDGYARGKPPEGSTWMTTTKPLAVVTGASSGIGLALTKVRPARLRPRTRCPGRRTRRGRGPAGLKSTRSGPTSPLPTGWRSSSSTSPRPAARSTRWPSTQGRHQRRIRRDHPAGGPPHRRRPQRALCGAPDQAGRVPGMVDRGQGRVLFTSSIASTSRGRTRPSTPRRRRFLRRSPKACV